jgi:hypothetical protein
MEFVAPGLLSKTWACDFRYSMLFTSAGFSTDLVILSIDQQLLSHDEFDGRVDSFQTLYYHVEVQMVFNFAKLNLRLELC